MRKVVVALWLFVLLMIAEIHIYASASNLQQIIESTPEYGVIELTGDTYHGNIVIAKPLSIIGSKNTIIRGDGTDNVISITADEVTLENLKVENSGKNRNSEEEYAAIKVHSNNNILKNITIDNSFHGVYLSQAHDNKLEGINITGSMTQMVAEQGNGVHVYYSNNNKLTNIIVSGTRDGLFFDYSNGNEVIGNTLSQTRYGLHFMYSDDNYFHQNHFNYNMGGAAIMNSHRNRVIDNDFSFNRSTRSFGVLLQMANENVIERNRFFQNQRGLFIDQSQLNRIVQNEIFQNQIGIEMWASAKHQTLTENHFLKNTSNVITIGGKSENNWSENERGNYWGTSTPLLDLNQDRVGDFPVKYTSSLYQLIEENELAYLFLNSPTIAIYEKINELINRQQVMFVDDYPLLKEDQKSSYVWVLLLVTVLYMGWYWYRRRERQ